MLVSQKFVSAIYKFTLHTQIVSNYAVENNKIRVLLTKRDMLSNSLIISISSSYVVDIFS